MNRSPINGVVLGAGKNASFALMLIRQAHELVGHVRLTVTKHLSFNQTHEAKGTFSFGRRVAMGFSSVHENVGHVALRLRKRVLLSFLGRAEQGGVVKLSRTSPMAFSTDIEHTAVLPLRAMRPVALMIDQAHELIGEINLHDIYTGFAPGNRLVGVSSSWRITAVAGNDITAGA